MAIPWTPDFDANAMKTARAPLWIDLPLLNPTFEYYANSLLAIIGTVLYAQTHHSRSKISHILGCVLYNLNEDLVEYINVEISRVGTYRVDVVYRTLPNACFNCKQRGYIAQYCPNKSGKEKRAQGGGRTETNPKDNGKENILVDADRFQQVGKHHNTKIQSPMQST